MDYMYIIWLIKHGTEEIVPVTLDLRASWLFWLDYTKWSPKWEQAAPKDMQKFLLLCPARVSESETAHQGIKEESGLRAL